MFGVMFDTATPAKRGSALLNVGTRILNVSKAQIPASILIDRILGASPFSEFRNCVAYKSCANRVNQRNPRLTDMANPKESRSVPGAVLDKPAYAGGVDCSAVVAARYSSNCS
ncbi:MAG: hypothetical protein AMXMBFR82_31800 [Candidatus Hydrogenedentota bacterium]